jgi:3-hydroxybutyryl-CoA dehydrogenase
MRFLCKKLCMRLWVLADQDQKEELLAQPIDETVLLEWPDSPGSVSGLNQGDVCMDLLFEQSPQRIKWLTTLPASMVIINSVVETLTQTSDTFVRINGWNTFLKRTVAEAACLQPDLKTKARELFSLLGRSVEWVPDMTGFIAPRIVVSIINEAFFSLEERLSSPEEIDTAMKLGTNYPLGPLEWGKKIGLKKVLSLLEILSQKEPRYEPSVLLRQAALA